MFVIILVILMSALYYMNYRRSRKLIYKFADTLQTVGELPIIGHSHWFIGGPEKVTNNIRLLLSKIDETGSTCRVWIGPTLYVVTTNLDDTQKILETCLEKDSSYRFLSSWIGNGLFVSPVDLWKSHRRLLLPVFKKNIVEKYVENFGKHGDTLVNRLESKVGQAEFDVYEYITSCMLDIVFETAVGEKMNVQFNPNTEYLNARKNLLSIISMRFFKAWLQCDALFNLTKHSKLQNDCIRITHKFTDEVIRKKKTAFENSSQSRSDMENNEGTKDILQLLLEREMNFSNVELREHMDSITIAGNDTTALVIAYALILLGKHQDLQEKVYEELNSIFVDSKRRPTSEDISKMEYLERVIKETLRLYPVVPIIARMTQEDTKLSTCTIPKGVGCAVCPLLIHKSKRIWGPDADDFNPDRFLSENCTTRHPCAYLPFSFGSRNCIGRRFGFLAMKSILSNILRSYKVTSDISKRLKIEILLFPVFGHLITLEKRIAPTTTIIT